VKSVRKSLCFLVSLSLDNQRDEPLLQLMQVMRRTAPAPNSSVTESNSLRFSMINF
jgi:hypothetical protein